MGEWEVAKSVVKSTKYCDVLKQSKVVDDTYTYCIEKIYVKSMNRNEVRFSVYKDTVRGQERYIPRSLDVTEIELIELIRNSLSKKIFSNEFIEMLKQELSKI